MSIDSTYLEKLKSILILSDFAKLSKITTVQVDKFILEAVELYNPEKVFICSDTPDEVAYIKHVYEDLVPLFKTLLNKNYTKEEYINQFTIRIPENLLKIECVTESWKTKVSDTPKEIFSVVESQKEQLIKAREKFEDYISPEKF